MSVFNWFRPRKNRFAFRGAYSQNTTEIQQSVIKENQANEVNNLIQLGEFTYTRGAGDIFLTWPQVAEIAVDLVDLI